jgi:hypothetical protein
MDLLRSLALLAYAGVAAVVLWGGMRVVLRRQRARTGPLRTEIEAGIQFDTVLDAARVYKTNGNLWGSDRSWFTLPGPARLTVGADAFIVSAPGAFAEYAFRARECSISLSQVPSPLFQPRDWIVINGTGITPLGGGRQAQLAISDEDLWEIWRALAAAGAVQH